jgi:hypothetical protein
MEWLCSDGTVVRLHGRVEGSSALATKLREQLQLLPFGRAADVQFAPPPGGEVRLDPANPYHVDVWLRQWIRVLERDGAGVKLERAPKLPPIPGEPYERGRVY